jgi:hypothetical protein
MIEGEETLNLEIYHWDKDPQGTEPNRNLEYRKKGAYFLAGHGEERERERKERIRQDRPKASKSPFDEVRTDTQLCFRHPQLLLINTM